MVPEGWSRSPLEKVAVVQTGIAKGKSGLTEPVSLPYLRVANVQDGHLNLTEIKKIEVEKSQINRYLLKKGDVLLTEGGDFDKLGRGDVWKGEIEPCLHQNHIFAVRVNRKILLPYFFSAQASSPYGKTYFLSCAKQTTNLASINSTQLKEFPILIPPLPEQQKIAQILSTWDRAIDTLEALIAAKQKRKTALMQQLLTGKRRLPGFGAPAANGKLPEEWLELKLGLVATLQRGFDLPQQKRIDGAYPIISSSGISGYHNEAKAGGPGVVTGRYGSIGGVFYIADDYWPLNTSLWVKDFHDNNRKFIYYLLCTVDFKILSDKTGVPGVNRNDAHRLIVKLPSLLEQQKIAAILSTADHEIDTHQRQLDALKAQKKGLMQQLLTGKKRVVLDEGLPAAVGD